MAKHLAKYPILVVGLVGAAFSCIKTGRDAIFFAKTGLDDLPMAYLWTEVGLAIGAYVHLSAMKRWGSRKTRLGVFVLCAVMFFGFVPFASAEHRALIQILFPLVPVVFAALFATAWLLAGDLLDGADGKLVQRVYGFTGASAMIGGILGALLAKAIAPMVSSSGLIGLGGGLLVASALVTVAAYGAKPLSKEERAADAPASKTEASLDLSALLRDPATRVLLAISALGTLTAMYVEFQFYAAAFAAGRAGPDFFADYYVVLCFASLALQIIVAPWIQSRFGVARTLLALPAGVLGGAGMVAFTANVMTQSLYRVVETALKNSIHRSSWEQVFLRFDRERRAAIKVMIDGTVPRVAGILGAVGLQVVLSVDRLRVSFGTAWPIWVLVPASAIWVYATVLLPRPTSAAPAQEVEHQIRVPDS